MKCHECGAPLTATTTDLPFKLNRRTIVVIRDLPVLQCENCPQYLIEDQVMGQVEAILNGIGEGAEIEVVEYAA